jgi:hypothetical protein
METPSTPTPRETKKVVTVAAPLTKKVKDAVMRKIESAKVKDIPYIECVVDSSTVWPPPSSPPWTTWSGLMLCAPDSPYAKRLTQKCGGLAVAENGTEFVGEGEPAAIVGFWTAPEDWQEMVAEQREEADKNGPQPTWTQKFEKLFEVA